MIAEAFERCEERYRHLPDLATQQHLRKAERRLQREIEQLRGESKTDIERGRNTLLTWLIRLMLARVGAMATLVKLL